VSGVAPAGAGEPLPTPAEIAAWPTAHLADAAQAWRMAAGTSTDAFEEHRRNIATPGGTEWEGMAKDAALGRVDGDIRVAGYHGEVLTEAASAAEDGLTAVKSAKREAVAALNEATDDGFTVADDLSVTDARRYDITTITERNKAAKEHAENIRWTAERLVQADAFVGQRLHAKATELHQLRFDGEGDHSGNHVQLVDNKTTAAGDGKDKPGTKPGDANGGLAGLLGVDDPATKSPDAKPPGEPGRPPANPLDLLAGKDGKGDGSSEHPRTLQDMMLPGGPPPAAGPGARPKFDPTTPEGRAGLAMARQVLMNDPRVPPAEVEQRLAAMTAQAQQPLPPPPVHEPPGPKPPLPGLGERLGERFNNFVNDAHNQFYDRLDSTVNTVENLTGTGGPGHPGVAESWEQAGKAHLSQLAHDPLHLRDPMGPLGPIAAVNSAVHDTPEMIEHPGKYAGDKLFDGTLMAATALPGGEGLLGRMLMPEAGALERGVVPEIGHTLDHGAPPVIPHTVEPPVTAHTPADVPRTGDHGLIGHSGDGGPAPSVEHHPSHPTGPLPPHGEPGSFGYDDDGNRMPYANDRPKYGPTQVLDTWDLSREEQIARIESGRADLPMPGPDQQWVRVLDDAQPPTMYVDGDGDRHGLIRWAPGMPRDGVWDMGHVGGQEYRDLRLEYLNGDLTFNQFMEQYRDPQNYRVQDPGRNRSHIDEGP